MRAAELAAVGAGAEERRAAAAPAVAPTHSAAVAPAPSAAVAPASSRFAAGAAETAAAAAVAPLQPLPLPPLVVEGEGEGEDERPVAAVPEVQATLQPSADLTALFGRLPSSFGSLPDELLF